MLFVRTVGGRTQEAVAYYATQQWLGHFSYRIDVGVRVFALAGAVVIAGLTVSYQSVKAALANPADALRTE